MTSSTTPELADLYHLGEQIERDKSASVTVLRQRDHEIGQRCAAPEDVGRLLFWLRNLPASDESAADGEAHWLSVASMAYVARLVAMVLGFAGMTTFLLASGRGLVNVFVFLLLFVLVQLVFCFASVLVMLRSVRGKVPVVLPLNPARLALARAFPDKRYLRESQSVVRLLILRYGQEFGAIFTLGAVAAFFVVLAFSDFTFVWGSTFAVSDEFVRRFTDLLAMPWSSWLPGATLPEQVIADSRYHPALTDLGAANITSMRGWWPFLIMAMVGYALVPRVVLWLLSKLFYVSLIRRSFVHYPGSESVLARMKSPVVNTQALEPGESRPPGPGVISADDGLILLNWAGALDAADSALYEETSAVLPENVLAAGLGSLADDAQCGNRVVQYKPERLLVAVKSWEPPMADLQDFLEGLESAGRCTLCLVPLPQRSVAEHNLQDWRDFSRQLPFDAIDVQPLSRL